MKKKIYPSQEVIKSRLDYNPETGVFTWRFCTEARKEWNTRYAGQIAGTVTQKGYLMLTIGKNKRCSLNFLAHNLAWILMYGEPVSDAFEIDHINGDKLDNRALNLRICNRSQNLHNKRGSSNKKSGLPKGVFLHNYGHKRFAAKIVSYGIHYCLGYFNTPEEAHTAYVEAAKKYHGEFARSA